MSNHRKGDANSKIDVEHEEDFRGSPSPDTEAVPVSSAADEREGSAPTPGAVDQEHFNNAIPVFLDRTYRMVDNVPDDIVCWSDAGDSFVIKQVTAFEGLLPSYYNHKKFLSFVRQLNFYGFKKVKGGAASRARSEGGAGMDGGAAELSWEEFRHPQFRRGRRDLLVGIKRQKDSGRLKRKRVDSQKMDAMSELRKDVSELSEEMKSVNGKLDEILSLLSGGGGQVRLPVEGDGHASNNSHPPYNNGRRVPAAGDARNVYSYGGGGGSISRTPNSFMTPAASAAVHGASGGGGYARWGMPGGSGGGGVGQGGHDPYVYGAPVGNYMAPRLPADHPHQQHQYHQHQQWQGHQLYAQQYQQPVPAEQYPVALNQVQYQTAQSPTPAGATGGLRTFGSSPARQLRQQEAPYHGVDAPGSSQNNISPTEHKKFGKGGNSSKVPPPKPVDGDDGGAGEDGASSSAATTGDSQQQQQQQQEEPRQQELTWVYPPSTNGGGSHGSGRGGGAVVAGTSHQRSSENGVSRLRVLSAARGAETTSPSSGYE